ncbi:MAG TPA: NfeD family protein, partial [Chitinophagales bacterium]|nr:NfeD family protein [Chitinophagales bacterium]
RLRFCRGKAQQQKGEAECRAFSHNFTVMIFSTGSFKIKASLFRLLCLKWNLCTALALLSFILINTAVFPQNDTSAARKMKIYTFTLDGDIFPAAWRLVKKAVDEAEAMQADYLIMRLNTYGGMVDIADSIRTKLLNAKPVTAVFIDHNAASAGALISIACDSIYMSRGSSIGAATVVGGTGEQMPDKYQSYMRSTMRATAEAQGRDPQIAEAMVDNTSAIPGVIDSGYTLTFTTSEAIKHGYCEGEAASIEEVIAKLGVQDYELITHKESALDDVIAFLLHPAVNSLLLLIIIGGIYFELQTPGVGFPLIAAFVAAILYFAPLYLEGLAENWEILLFIAGLALLAVEIFVLPGFGVAGIAAIVLMVTGLTLSLIRNVVFDFSFTGFDDVAIALLRVVVTLLAGLLLMLFFGEKFMYKGSFFKKIALQDTQNRAQGYVSLDKSMESLVGKTGITVTDLRPAGTVEIDNERYDVISDGEHIVRNSTVKVLKVQGNYLVVTKV